MNGRIRGFRGAVVAAWCAAALGTVGGCGDGRPSVSASAEEATVHGTVTVRGRRATGGTVTFDPSNVRRRDAPAVRTEIGKDGTYTLRTLVGGNKISVNSPETLRDPGLQYLAIPFEVPRGDVAHDIAIPPPSP